MFFFKEKVALKRKISGVLHSAPSMHCTTDVSYMSKPLHELHIPKSKKIIVIKIASEVDPSIHK